MMWDRPLPPNTRAHPYRGLSVQEVDVPLTEEAILGYLDGREVYRRTDFLALRHGGATALVEVRKASLEPLFSPVVAARVISGPDDTAWVERPEVDVGNATALAGAAVPGAATTVVLGRFEHVNFMHRPAPIPVRVTEVVPPEPAKLLAQAEQAVEFDEDLPPVELILDAVEVEADGGGTSRAGLPAAVPGLGRRPRGRAGVLPGHPTGRARRLAAHRLRALAAVPPALLRRRARAGRPVPAQPLASAAGKVLTKCCLIERGLEVDGDTAVVPWGANLDEVREGLRKLLL